MGHQSFLLLHSQGGVLQQPSPQRQDSGHLRGPRKGGGAQMNGWVIAAIVLLVVVVLAVLVGTPV
jgi:hypothetical protein